MKGWISVTDDVGRGYTLQHLKNFIRQTLAEQLTLPSSCFQSHPQNFNISLGIEFNVHKARPF